MSLESSIKKFFENNKIEFTDNCSSSTLPDFCVHMRGGVNFYLEVKEKRRPTKMSNWPNTGVPEKETFILDELTARRLFYHAPYSGVLVYSFPTKSLTFFDVSTLWTIPRTRVDRIINEHGTAKGKWMLDLRNGKKCGSFTIALRSMANYVTTYKDTWLEETACIGDYTGETILNGGELRTRQQRQYDYAVTR